MAIVLEANYIDRRTDGNGIFWVIFPTWCRHSIFPMRNCAEKCCPRTHKSGSGYRPSKSLRGHPVDT